MVFVYDEDTTGAFWMRNTPMPLSIAYFDAGGRLVSTHRHGAVPRTRRTARPTRPTGPYRYALEVPQGRLDDLGITASAPRCGWAAPAARPSERRRREAVRPGRRA